MVPSKLFLSKIHLQNIRYKKNYDKRIENLLVFKYTLYTIFQGVIKMKYKHWQKLLLALSSLFWNSCNSSPDVTSPSSSDLSMDAKNAAEVLAKELLTYDKTLSQETGQS